MFTRLQRKPDFPVSHLTQRRYVFNSSVQDVFDSSSLRTKLHLIKAACVPIILASIVAMRRALSVTHYLRIEGVYIAICPVRSSVCMYASSRDT